MTIDEIITKAQKKNMISGYTPLIYEYAKQDLRRLDLTEGEYEQAIKRLCEVLSI